MRFALVPGNSSLSHVLRCLAIRRSLFDRGHEVVVVVGRKHQPFLRGLAIPHEVLPDIQENDGANLPTVEWFRHPGKIAEVIRAETDFLKRFRPDRVLGIFRFTTRASCAIVDRPYDSLICGCMTPEFDGVLGFDNNHPCADLQRDNMAGFFRYAAARLSSALKAFPVEGVDDIRTMLKGERTFLWDVPEFLSLPRRDNVIHAGPIFIDGLLAEDFEMGSIADGSRPLAVVASGTCVSNIVAAKRITGILRDNGYRVVLAGGGQKELLGVMAAEPWVISGSFVPLNKVLPLSSLIVCHGGQGTIFEALHNRVPVAVMPFQPEQAHNGICLERLGCGALLVPPQPFRGNPRVYVEALAGVPDEEILARIRGLVENAETTKNLARMKEAIDRYRGTDTVTSMLEAL